MKSVALTADKRGYIAQVLHDLISCGWHLSNAPLNGRIPRNGIKIILKTPEQELRLRIFIYKVTSSSRNRSHERRVEITTTYKSGLKPLSGFGDIVLGVDADSGNYVGIDSRRLRFGGSTHNASSFFDPEGLSVKAGKLLVNPRRATAQLFPGGIEFHSFFNKKRLSEYFFNYQDIHAGTYAYGGSFSGLIKEKNTTLPLTINSANLLDDVFVLYSKPPKRPRLEKTKLIEAVESKDFSKLGKKSKKITPEQLKQLLAICDEIGALGEQAVLFHERKRLIKLGHKAKANQVERVSLQSVSEGYDIISFEDDGVTPRYLEVKSTIGNGAWVDISRGEWEAAKKYKAHYYLVRVTEVKKTPKIFFVRNPIKLEQQGHIQKTETGWKINLHAVMK
jgi:hypothetical protein